MVAMFPQTEMLDLVVEDGRAVGIVTRDLVSGKIESHAAHAVLLCTGGYSNVYYLSTNAMGCNATAIWRAYRRGALFANPSFAQIHPTCIPQSGEHQSKLTLMSESLRNDARIWVPERAGDERRPGDIPQSERDHYLERKYPAFGNLVPRDVASRNAKEVVDEGRGVGPRKNGVYLDFSDAIRRLGRATVEERYGNLFEMYERITGEDPYDSPMRIFPAPHYTMGGLWVDYNLMSTIRGLFVLGEANFSDHGANRLGASALMQGLADGYFVAPYTVPDFLADHLGEGVGTDHEAFRRTEAEVAGRIERLLAADGRRTVDSVHRELGRVVWEECGMARSGTGLRKALERIPELHREFEQNVRLVGGAHEINTEREKAGRLEDYLELAALMCRDALQREESCGCHFRVEYQTAGGEALRRDETFSSVSAWEYRGPDREPVLREERLSFEFVQPTTRSYK
jgi:succinate dehydrogenase / fumarate reductase flavoprotein subunit